jgi:phage host-nuclease inhibitor protein Gam
MRRLHIPLIAAMALVAAACGTDRQETFETVDADAIASPPSAAMRAQFAQLRSEVDSIVGVLRSEVDSLQQQAAGDTLEAWTDTAIQVTERQGDLLVNLDRLDSATADEARDIRADIASDLAQMEADVVRQEVRHGSATQYQAVALNIEERLARLEANLDSISMHSMAYHSGNVQIDRTGQAVDPSLQRPPTADTGMDRMRATGMTGMGTSADRADDLPDPEEIRNLREELQEVRGEVVRLRTASGQDEWEDIREDLGNQVADLTRQVREHWYNVRYSFRDGMGQTMTPPGMDRGG